MDRPLGFSRRSFVKLATAGVAVPCFCSNHAARGERAQESTTGARIAQRPQAGARLPMLFFGRDDVPKLKAEAKDAKKAIWNRVLQAAEGYLGQPTPQPNLSQPWAAYLSCAEKRRTIVRACSFAYLMTGRDEFHRRAKQDIDAILQWERWIDPDHDRSLDYSLMTGIISAALAHYLDWCGAAVSGEEKATIVEHHKRKAVKPLLHDMAVPAPFFKDRVNNHIAVDVSGAGLMALLLMDEEPVYREVLEKCVFHLRRYVNWINDDGSTDEGGGYWTFGMEHAALLLDALRANAGRLPERLNWERVGEMYRLPKGLRSRTPLEKTGYFPLYCIQGSQYVVDFGDTRIEDADRMQPVFLWLARVWRNGHLQWQADRLESDKPLAFIWCDPTVDSKRPTDLVSSKAFHGAGWGILRSDLEDPNGVLLAIRAGHNSMTHRHYDLGTIIVRAGGRGVIVDSGHPTYSKDFWSGKRDYHRETIGHNCVLVDGKGQRHGPQNRAEITRLQDFGNEKYLCIDIRCPSNGIELHRRQITVTLSDKTSADLLINDEIQLAKSAQVTWLFHFEEEADAEVDGNRVTVKNGPARLTMNIPPDAPVTMSIERDHPIPFVSIASKVKETRHSLKLTCKIEVA